MTFPEITPDAALPDEGRGRPRPQSSLRSIALVTGLTLLQLVFQFALQLVMARYFGAASEVDAYVAALALPVVVATILSGSLGYVLVPVVAEQLGERGQRDAATVASQIGLYLIGLSLLITLVVAAAAPPLANVLCPGFSPAERGLTAKLLGVLSALILANSLIAYFNALFHCYRRFAAPAVAGVIGTLATLLYVIALHDRQGIFAVAWGVVVGAGVTIAMLLPFFGWQLWESKSWTLLPHPATSKCLQLLVPLVLGAIYWRLDPLLDRLLGSYLPAVGSLAHLGYAWRLVSGLMLVGTSGLSIVAFPAIAAHAAAQRRTELGAEVAYALRLLLVLVVPICIGLVAFATPVVRLLFEHGKFTPTDTRGVALLVALYVGVILGAGLGDLLSRTLYALQDMRTPVLLSAVAFTFAAGLKYALVWPYGAAGLVAATSFYYLLNATLLTAVLLTRLSPDMLAGTAAALARSGASSLVACLAASAVMGLPTPLAVLPAAICGALVYGTAMWFFGDEFAQRCQRALWHREGA